jgi:RTX calcium-binding nonapeptide repeat (4 copies)
MTKLSRRPRALDRRTIALALAGMALAGFVAATGVTARITGTPRADVLRGTANADRLEGRGGNDRLFGLGGNDLLIGGRGADRIRCGPGHDRAVADRRDHIAKDCEVVRGLTPPAPPPSPPPPPSLSPVAVENQQPGTPGWGNVSRAPEGVIEGYTQPTAAPGDTLTFHVSADPAAPYRIAVFRVGYYGGVGARLVACLPSCGSSAEATPQSVPAASPEGLVHANWPVSQRLQIPADWVSGYYLAWITLTGGDHAGQAHPAWFTLREPPDGRRAPILVQGAQTTWQAYNGWGGGSLYEFNSPSGARAAKVAFDRPYDRTSPAGADAWELPLVRFLERLGYDVAYQADVDTARDPGSLQRRRLIIVAGHSEYWAKEVRDAFEQARANGTNLAFMGANAAYWQVRYEDEYRTVVGYKSSSWDPEPDHQRKTNLFRSLVPPRYECALIGIQHQGGSLEWVTEGDYTVTEAAESDRWLIAGGFKPGDVVRGIVSREVDTIPPNQTAADSCGNRLTVLFHREFGGDTLGNADAVRYTAPSGAKIFASGSHQFVWGLEDVLEMPMGHGLVDARLQRFAIAMLNDLALQPRQSPELTRADVRRGGRDPAAPSPHGPARRR